MCYFKHYEYGDRQRFATITITIKSGKTFILGDFTSTRINYKLCARTKSNKLI